MRQAIGNKPEQRTLQERTERLIEEIDIPEAFARRVREEIPGALSGTPAEAGSDGAGILARQLAEAAESRENGPWKRIPEEIWLETMKCYARFIGEHYRSYGRYGFDRSEWTVRQAGCRLFRIGELEYELAEEKGQRAVSLHIPSDARLDAEILNESLGQAKVFLGEYYPEWQELPMVCESWLLSPALKEMLPPESRILRFQEAFDLTETDPEDTTALEWVFHVAEGQRAAMKTEALPEETSLQRRMKALLLAGGKPGNARGVLVRPFRSDGD